MKRGMLALFLLFCFWLPRAHAQDETLTTISTAPCKEIYDLLEDRKGFIWIGDNLGLRRFDGVSFTAYAHPSESSISMSGLCEDGTGRIWCHNFGGQIFYVEHERMHLLEGYDYKVETAYPNMALCGDELLASSRRGLFVCNTKTLQCRYILTDSSIVSLTVINNKAILFGAGKWYIYQKEKGVERLSISTGNFAQPNLLSIVLFTNSDGKRIFASSQPNTSLYIFSLTSNGLTLTDVKKYPSFINTISVKKSEVWVHTKTSSYSLTDSSVLAGYNLSCILKDKEGNQWSSSLEKGLLVTYGSQKQTIVKTASLANGDFIRCLKQSNSYFVEGSQQGKIYVADRTQKTIQQYELPKGAGAVEKIEVIGKDNFYLECSAGLYLLQPNAKTLRCLSNLVFPKDVALVDSLLYIGTPRGLINPRFTILEGIKGNPGYKLYEKSQRCRAVRYDSSTKSLFIAYADGLYCLQNKEMKPVLYQNKSLYVSSLEYYKGKIYAGTFNGDFVAIQNGAFTKYKTESGSAILRMKLCGNYLWILKTSGVSVFDLANETFHYNRELAYLNGGDIYDLEEIKGEVYYSTAEALYKIQLQDNTPLQPPLLYLLYITINNRDTAFDNRSRFSPKSGSLSFYLAAPWLHNNSDVRIRYTLLNTNKQNKDSLIWSYLEPNNRIIQFNSLQPGSYSLQIEAGVNGDFTYASSHINYAFTIWKRWYNHTWFYALMAAVTLVLLWTFYKYRIRQLTRIEKLRRQISGDLHDDIGSTMSSINIYSQLIKNGRNPSDYIDIIQTNTVQVINSLDDVVWNINPKNDTLAQLISRMKLFALPYLNDNGIEASFDTDIEKEDRVLSTEVRTDCYLVFKEAINNLVKHANCTTCHIFLYQRKKELRLQVKDNGKGFNVNEDALHRNGLTTMRVRTRQLRGKLIVNSSPGNGTEIILNCRISLF